MNPDYVKAAMERVIDALVKIRNIPADDPYARPQMNSGDLTVLAYNAEQDALAIRDALADTEADYQAARERAGRVTKLLAQSTLAALRYREALEALVEEMSHLENHGGVGNHRAVIGRARVVLHEPGWGQHNHGHGLHTHNFDADHPVPEVDLLRGVIAGIQREASHIVRDANDALRTIDVTMPPGSVGRHDGLTDEMGG